MTKIEEIWKAIPNTPMYEVSNFGNVRAPERWVKTHSNKVKLHKPKSVALTDNGRGYKLFGTKVITKKNYYIHRMVATLFIHNPNNLPEVNHKDGIKSNNHVDNLEWISLQGNRDHAVANNLIPSGEKSHYAKLKLQDVINIRQTMKDNPNQNICALARSYNIRDTTIHKIIKGQRWKRSFNQTTQP